MIQWMNVNIPYFMEELNNLNEEVTISVGAQKVYKTLLIVFAAEENIDFKG